MNCKSARFPRFARSLLRTTLSVLICGVFFSALGMAKSRPKLSPQYQQWLERDVVYLITKEEKDSFLQLEADADRDKAIQQFWEVRNPNPGAPINEYKDEIYKRIAYANEHFGTPGVNNGWHTDQGRAYITLGPPQQMAPYRQPQQTRPMEIWFYQNANPALPPYFSMIFYQRDIGDEYRLYSPYFDGPDKLVTSVNAVNDRRRALDLIDRELGREVARTTLSLIPSEPVDMDGATSSMDSDLMLSVFKTLANHPLTKDRLRRNRDLLSSVGHRVILGDEYVDVLTTTLQDASGSPSLHYLIRMMKPVDFTVGKSEGRYYYSIRVSTKITDADGKVVVNKEKDIANLLDGDQFEKIKGKVFGYEGVTPLPPGKYKLELELTNRLTETGYKTDREIVVPNVTLEGLRLSDMVPFSEATPTTAGSATAPFEAGGVKFTPQVGEQLSLVPGQDLKVMYQIWEPAADPHSHSGQKLLVEYTYGRPSLSSDSKSTKEEVVRDQFDKHGSLTSGTKVPTADLPPGNYRLLVTVTDPETGQKVYTSTNFRIGESSQAVAAWDVTDQDAAKEPLKGVVAETQPTK